MHRTSQLLIAAALVQPATSFAQGKYGRVYGDANASAIDLGGALTHLNLAADDGAFLTAADAALAPEPSMVAVAGLSTAAWLSCRSPLRCSGSC